MKKLLYLLLAITFIGCSSDDNSNEDPANQLFLDIYDGIVWRIEQPKEDYFSDKLTFYSNPSSMSVFYDVCDTVIFGEPYPFTDDGVVIGEVTYSIQNEGQNNIVIFGQFVDNEGNVSPQTRTITCTVSSGGNALLLEDFILGAGILRTNTYIIAPDEFPCN